ncbi:MAG: hypothetical protein K8S25_13895 [Alphaproteobacteria bacterium]|nr:hypothetical protein [Alphaproteobacteria bacterium]
MGAWYVCRDDARADARLAQATAQFLRHGHAAPRTLATAHHKVLHTGHIHAGLPTFAQVGEDFAAIAGTFFYRGEAGDLALKLLLADFEPPFNRWSDVLGHFAALVYKRGRLFAFTDWSASFHMYYTADRSVVSTSFLSTAASLSSLSFNPQSVYEFVFAGTPLGNDTVFAEISRPARTQQLELGEHVTVHELPHDLVVHETSEPVEDMIARIAANLRTSFAVPAKHYGNNIQCPLSGGFDSRLVLSLLLDTGVRPSLYVYGGPDDIDVRIASHIAKQEGFDIETFEKGAFRKVEPDEFPAIAEKNFHEMDGTPMDGGMFDSGGNSHGRNRRATGGALAVSGAAGEIYRNYFYLADRPFSTRDVIDAFYAIFDPSDCTAVFDENEYLSRLNVKLQAALGAGSERQKRLDIERAYPLFRCPAAFGREISMVGRFGAYFVPFCDYAMTREAANIPVKWRTHGVFQSMLLEHINPRLAAYQSAYGHSFTQRPTVNHRLADAMSLYRPPWLRRYGYRMKRKLARAQDPRIGFMAPRYLDRTLDSSFPAMSRFFNMTHMQEPGFFRAVATLEYLAQHFSDRLKG